MRRKIAVNDLEISMYVTELDRPWTQAPFEPPFEFQGFKVSTEIELDKVKKLCEYVYIDPKFGKEAQNYLPDTYGLRDITQVVASFTDSAAPVQYSTETKMDQEIPLAQKALKAANEAYVQMSSDVRNGGTINEGQLQIAVLALVDSVSRNPDALIWLVGQQEKNSRIFISPISITALALVLGRSLKLSREIMEVLATATMLQDIGMYTMPDELLNKTTSLTAEESETLKGHVDASVKLAEQAGSFSSEVVQTIRKHHERLDGSGYPRGISGDEVTTLAMISGIVDCYQSGISERPYRKAKTSYQVLMELNADKGTTFATEVVEQFIQCVGIFPVGSFVELNTKEIAVVVNRNPAQQLKPTVKIVCNNNGDRIKESVILDLTRQNTAGGEPPRLVTKAIDPGEINLDVRGILA